MDDVYIPADYSKKQDRRFIYASFPSSDRNKISEEDYIVLKKKIGNDTLVFEKENRFKILDNKKISETLDNSFFLKKISEKFANKGFIF